MVKISKVVIMMMIMVFLLQTIQTGQAYNNLTISDDKIADTNDIDFKKLNIHMNAHETFLNTSIILETLNTVNESVSSEIKFQIPTGSYITNLSMSINNMTFWGQVNRLAEAQSIYQNATQEGKSAILLTQVGFNLYKLEFNVARLASVNVGVYYFQRLVRTRGLYDIEVNYPSLPLIPQNWNTLINIESPLRDISKVSSPTSYTQLNVSSSEFRLQRTGTNQDFPNSLKESVSYELSGNNYGTNIFTYSNGTNEFFYATFTPVLETPTEQIGKDFVFVLDVSGSMSGTKIDQAKSALLVILNDLYTDDRVGIVKFSNSVTKAKNTLVNKSDLNNIDFLKGWVAELEAGGNTDILSGLEAGIDFFDSSTRPKIIVLLTDGVPTAGTTDISKIESEFTTYNNEKGASLYTLGFGSDVDFNFLQRIARENNGEGVQIPADDNSLEALTSFYDMISTPLLVDMSVSINSGVLGSLYPYFLPNLYDGSELFLVGQRNGNIDITITGQTASTTQSWNLIYTKTSSIDLKDLWVADLWAITIINDLLARIRYSTTDTTSLKEKVIEIALNFGLITPYTGMTVVVPDFESIINQSSSTDPEGYVPGSYSYTTQYAYASTSVDRNLKSNVTAATPGFEYVIGFSAVFIAVIYRQQKRKKN